MVLIETEVYDRLSTDAGVIAIVGTNVYPIPGDTDTTKPYVMFQRVSTTPLRGLKGNQNFATHRIQVASVGTTYLEAKQLANAVRNAMDSTSTHTVMDNEIDMVDENAGVFTVQDYLIFRALDT